MQLAFVFVLLSHDFHLFVLKPHYFACGSLQMDSCIFRLCCFFCVFEVDFDSIINIDVFAHFAEVALRVDYLSVCSDAVEMILLRDRNAKVVILHEDVSIEGIHYYLMNCLLEVFAVFVVRLDFDPLLV